MSLPLDQRRGPCEEAGTVGRWEGGGRAALGTSAPEGNPGAGEATHLKPDHSSMEQGTPCPQGWPSGTCFLGGRDHLL